MLSRVVSQSVRSPVLRTAVRQGHATSLIATRTWTRGMAKNNSPGSRFAPPSNSSQPSRKAPAEHTLNPLASRPNQNQTPSKNPEKPEQAAASPSAESWPPHSAPIKEPPRSEESEQPEAEKKIPLSSLPDITQGLPSTLEYETAGASKASRLALEGVASAGGRGKGELPASAYVSSSERKRQRFANYMFATMALGTVGGTIYLGRNWNEEDLEKHRDVPNGWGLGLWWNRAMTRIKETMNYYQEPSFEKLLPDVDTNPMMARPYTLIISLEDMLVHSEWSREHGWRVAKRPGVDYFIRYLSQYYELVLFTSVPYGIAEPLWRKMDPFHFVTWPLFREATKYQDGKIVKDLSYLNRDLSKVIIIDTDPDHVSAQPENAIVLPKWTGDPEDKDLVALIPFLEYIYTMQYGDVRDVLKSFEGKKIPEEFARREAIARKKFTEQLEAERKKHRLQGGGMAALGSMFGLKPNKMSLMVSPDGEESITEALAQGKMLQDIQRERGQRMYEIMEKQVRENGEAWLKEEAEQLEKMQQEAMASMKSSFVGWFRGPPSGPSPTSTSGAGGAPPPADEKNKEGTGNP